MQPLPFFTSVHQAASFMGRSRRDALPLDEGAGAGEDGNRISRINADQDAFLLAPKKVTLPVIGKDPEFEFVRPDAPEHAA
jgi:hypothetical protein